MRFWPFGRKKEKKPTRGELRLQYVRENNAVVVCVSWPQNDAVEAKGLAETLRLLRAGALDSLIAETVLKAGQDNGATQQAREIVSHAYENAPVISPTGVFGGL